MENLSKLINQKMFELNKSNKTFKDIFEITHNQGDKIFCELTDGYKIKKISYKECKEKCVRNALYLEGVLRDIPKNSFIGLMMDNSVLWITTFWGLLMAGYKPLLLNLRLSDALLNDVVQLAKVDTVICDKDYNLNINSIVVNENTIDNQLFINKDFNWADEIALSTSATSLNIKVCVYAGYQIASQIENTKNIVKSNPMIKSGYKKHGNIKIMTFLPLYHVFGLVATYFWFSFFGRTFVFLKDMSSDTILKTVRKHKVTHLFSVPMMWNTIYKEVLRQVAKKDEATKKKFKKGIELSIKIQNVFPKVGLWLAKKLFKEVQDKVFGDSIKFLITGGSYISNDVLKLFNGIGYPLYNGYGMSEIGITSVELRKKAKYRILGTIGKPFKSIEYRINDNGILEVKGESICEEIITKNDSIKMDHSKWFSTNDIASIDKKGYYYINGRYDDVVISSSGEKINPDLIEKKLYLPSVNRYSIIGLNIETNNYLSLIVEISSNVVKLKIKKIVNEVENNISVLKEEGYFIEKIFYTYDAIAAATAIKVSRNILQKWIDNKTVNLRPYQELKNMNFDSVDEIESEISEKIKNIMASILMIEPKNIMSDAHFVLDLGATSLDYLTLLIKLKEEFDIEFEFKDNDNCYSVGEFVNYISKKTK